MNKEPPPLFRSNCSIPKVYIPPSLQILRVAPHLSVTRNPRKELFWVVALHPQSRPRYLQSARLRMDSGFLAILRQFRRIAHRLDRNCAHSDCTWIAIRGLRLEPWPQTHVRGSSAILSIPRNPIAIQGFTKAGPVNCGRVNLACGTNGTEQRGNYNH